MFKYCLEVSIHVEDIIETLRACEVWSSSRKLPQPEGDAVSKIPPDARRQFVGCSQKKQIASSEASSVVGEWWPSEDVEAKEELSLISNLRYSRINTLLVRAFKKYLILFSALAYSGAEKKLKFDGI